MNRYADEFIGTFNSPFFLYDLDSLSKWIQGLGGENLDLFYAVKANPLSAIIQTISGSGWRFDVASSGELKQVLKQGVSPEHLINTGPAKSAEQIQTFIDAGVTTFVVESQNQLVTLNKLAPIGTKVLLRVQIEFSDPSGFAPLSGGAFGLKINDWQAVDLLKYPNLDVIGLHCFQWANLQIADEIVEKWRYVAPQLKSLADYMGINFRVLDLGGGLGVPYCGETPINWADVYKHIPEIRNQVGVERIWLELGRYAVGAFGSYFTKVIDRKTNGDSEQLILEGGINHLMRPAIAGQPFPSKMLNPRSEALREFEIYGPLCTGLDDLGKASLPTDIQPGDWVQFDMVGAYGFTESMPLFLCHTLAAEAVIKDGKMKILREPQLAENWLV